jgi:autotransporter-associated beta strand protein
LPGATALAARYFSNCSFGSRHGDPSRGSMAFRSPPHSREVFMTNNRSSLGTASCRGVLRGAAGNGAAEGPSSPVNPAARRTRRTKLWLLASALSFAAAAGSNPAAAQSTWNGATTDYNTNANWTPNTAPVSAGQSAIFSTTGTTAVNVSAAVSPDSWTFNSNSQSYAVTGSSVTFSGGGIINNANAGQVISIGNIIGGTGAVQQLGNSTLQLSGANTYTGGTVISAGTLQLTGSGPGVNPLGNLNGTTTISGGALDFGGHGGANIYIQGTLNQSSGTVQNGSIAILGSYHLTGGVVAANASIGVGGTIDLQSGTVNGQLNGSAPLQKSTAGTVTLAGINSYTGGTVISAGTLQLTGNGTLGDQQGTTTISGGTLDLGQVIRDVNIPIQTALNQSGGTVQNGIFAVNTYQLTGGTLATSGAIFAQTIGGLHGTVLFDMQSGTVNGELNGSAPLQKSTAGTVTLAGANGYSGGTVISAGTLALTGAGTLGATTNSTAISGGTLDLGTTTQTQASLSQSGGTVQNGTMNVGSYQLTGGTLASTTLVSASTSFDMQAGTVNGLLSGAGQLQKSTAGTVTLSAANTYSGGTVISAGTLALTGAGTLGAATNASAISGGTLDLGTSMQTQASLSQSGGTVQNGGMNVGSYLLTGGSLAATAFVSASTSFDIRAGTVNGVLAGAGALQKSTASTVTLSAADTYTGATVISGGTLALTGAGSIAHSSQVNLANAAGTFDISGTTAGASITTLAGVANSHVTLGAQTLTLSNGSTSYAGIIQGTGGLAMTGGTQTLTAVDTYTGATTINGGTLVVNGSIVTSSLTTVNAGGTFAGAGLVGALTVNSGGAFAPGPLGSTGSMAVLGNLTFRPGAAFLVQVTPSIASAAIVNGTASLAGTVNAQFSPGSYMVNNYVILAAAGGRTGTFGNLVTTNLPVGFTASLSYGANDAVLGLNARLASSGGFGAGQSTIAGPINSAFNNGGALPPGFVALFGLTGANLNAALTQLSGETAVGSQQATFNAMTLFMGTLLDHLIGGEGSASTPGATPYAEESADASASDSGGEQRSNYERDAYGMMTKIRPRNNWFDPHWSVWTSGFGGSQTSNGNATLGSNSATSGVFGAAAGADYWLSPNTIAGFALAGGGTTFTVANAGGGRSDLFQAGAFIKHNVGAAYISGAVAYGWQDITTDRTVTVAGIDRLHARFNAIAYSGRVESGYRFVAPWIGVGITPYAAGQFTTFDLPAYAEQVLSGANTFALAYGAKSVTASRSELGVRTDKSWAMQDAILTLRGRTAWAHDFNPDRSIGATFQTLPGASFVVNGAAQARNSALSTASAEMKWQNGFALAATFEGEFSDVTRSYAGKGVARYSW